MSKIKIDTEAVRTKIDLLKSEKTKIDDAFGNYKKDVSNIDTFWTGTSGDSVKEEMDTYTGKFEAISKHVQKFIDFLEYVAKTYEDEDELIIKNIESNANIPVK